MKLTQYLVLVFLCFLLQPAPFTILPVSLARPDIGLILTLHCSLDWGRERGLLFGAAMGFMRDLLLCGAVGQGTLAWGLAGFTAGALREGYISGEFGVKLILVSLATAADTLIQALMTRMVMSVDVGPAVLGSLADQLISNLLFSAIALPLLSVLDDFVGRKSAQLERRRRMKSFVAGMGATGR
ncbi:MAG: rod shape-determining protein MreD [Nitrospinota bacterium]|nr:rod shape-determining protein MreD [Nitrospinota bacterium]